MSSSEYSALLSELQKLSSSNQPPNDEETRQRLSEELRKASMSIETPLEAVRRISYAPLQIVVTKIGINLGIFEILSNEEAIALDELVSRTGAERGLLKRILRFLASLGLISQRDKATYGPTKLTHALSEKGFRAGIVNHIDIHSPAWFTLPSFLASTNYISPPSSTQTAFQKAHDTPLQAFAWASQRPQIMNDFALWMSAQRTEEKSWLTAFTPDEISGNRVTELKSKQPLFVDVGGGVGHQSYALRAWLPPSVPTDTEIIFQDLPSVISFAKAKASVEGVQPMVHDMFLPQPVKDAKFYYLRNVLHDYSNTPCITILENIKSAMGDHSTLLIDELILPEIVNGGSRNVEFAASLDMVMMAGLGGQERTRSDWDDLFGAVGMHVEELRRYDQKGNGILVIKKK